MDGDLFKGDQPAVHPLADVAPMLSEDQLAELAADIAERGLQHPIIRTIDGKTIVDGRNRLAACRLAGIEPTFDDCVETEEQARAVIASENLQRRNLTASQRAMWQAFLAPEAQHGGNRRSADFKSTQLTRSETELLRRARAVLRYSQPLARTIIEDPTASLNTAYEQATSLHRQQERQATEDRRLREVAPGLMRRVDNGEITRAEARTLWETETREARESRRVVYQALYEFSKLARGVTGTPSILELPDWLATEEYESEFREFFKGGPKQLIEEAEIARDAAKTLDALAAKFARGAKK